MSLFHGFEVRDFPMHTRTAAEAASAIGCTISEICKSIVFRSREELVMILTSGSNRVNTVAVEQHIGKKLAKADADWVKSMTGYTIGGVSPLGLLHPAQMYIDEDLLTHETVWAAAGTPTSVFAITPRELVRITGATVICVK